MFVDGQSEIWVVQGLAQSHTVNLFYNDHVSIWDMTHGPCEAFMCSFIHTSYKHDVITNFMSDAMFNAVLCSLMFLILNAFLHPQ